MKPARLLLPDALMKEVEEHRTSPLHPTNPLGCRFCLLLMRARAVLLTKQSPNKKEAAHGNKEG